MPRDDGFTHVGKSADIATSPEIDFEAARETMVESQLRPTGIDDRRLVSAMGSVPRERFVSAASRPLAYMDGAVPVDTACGEMPRYLLPPMVLAHMVQSADLEPDERVLVVGCASGYSVVVLSTLVREVVGLESDPALAAQAETNLKGLGVTNATILRGPLADGAASGGLYDAILLDGGIPAIPAALQEQVKEGGRLVGVVSKGVQGTVYLFVKSAGELAALPQFSAGAEPLPGFAREAAFDF